MFYRPKNPIDDVMDYVIILKEDKSNQIEKTKKQISKKQKTKGKTIKQHHFFFFFFFSFSFLYLKYKALHISVCVSVQNK